MKRCALVTGGAGFIGSILAKRLIEEGWKVFVIDNLSTGFRDNIPKAAEFLELDISKESFVSSLPAKGVDIVFHLAAQSSGEISFEDPLYDLKTNSMGTLLLLNWCKEKRIRRFIYASSMSIYGEVEKLPVKEDVSLQPKSFYGVGKLASENYLRIFESMGVNSTALRLFNVYGPGQNMENLKQGMVSIYIAYIAKDKPILVKGSKDRFRDFIYIDDVIESFIRVVDETNSYGKCYNVCTGKKTCVWELLDGIVQTFGYKPGEYPIVFAKGTPGDQYGIYGDITKIKNDLGWEPKVSLTEGLRRMVNWVRGVVK